MGSSGSTIKSNQGESPTPDRSQIQPKTQKSPKKQTPPNKQTPPKKKKDDVKTFVPFTGFPTVERLAKAQADYAAAKLPVKRGDDGVPEPFPPPTKKADVFRPEDFKTIDAYARETPLSEAETFSSLVTYLTTPARSDIDKIRAFYVWTATQKSGEIVRLARSDMPADETPLWYLLQIYEQHDNSYYDMTFNTLCKTAGIPCHIMKGKVKGAIYQPGKSVTVYKRYNAVFVDGAWRFVDQHWGSSYVTIDADEDWELLADGGAGKTTGNTGTYQRCDDDWFLTDPELMICTHLPEDPALQLLARPITSDEFEQMAYLRLSYFDFGLHSLSKPKCVIFTDTGDVTLEFGLPENYEHTFLYALYKSALDQTRDRMNGAQLKQYVFMDVSKKQKKLRVHIEFPWIGKYKIDLYGRVLGRNSSSELCVYVIHCQKPKFTSKPHPLADRDLWGAGGEAEAIGLEPVNHDGGLIIAEDGHAEMAFKMTLAKYMQFKYTLESDDIDQQTLINYVIHYVIDGEVYFLAKLPAFGKYVFKLFAKDTRRHTQFQHVSNYLITSDMGCADQKEFPKSDTRQVGLMDDSGAGVTITAVSHRRPLITCKDKGEVDIKMSTDRDAEISAHLVRDDKGNAADFSNHVFIERDGKDFTLNVTFPKVGMYLLTVYARPAGGSDDDETATSFKYVINVKKPKLQCTPFPKPLEWNNEFRLIEPKNANLEPDKEVHFAVIVPGATQVYVDNAKNSALASKGQDRWEGDVIPSSGDAELKVYGVFEEDNKSLLEYQILTRSQTEKVEEEQERRMREAELAKQQEESRRQKEREAAEARRQREEEEAERKARDFEENRTQYEEEEAKWQEEEGDFEVETTPTIERQSTMVKAENPEEAWVTWKEQHADMASTMLLTRLGQATRLRERGLLTKAVRDCREAGLADHEAVVKADRLLRVLAMRTKLQNAVDERELNELLATIREVEDLGFEKSLQQEMIVARGLAEHLTRLQQLKLVILNMDKNTMTEIRRYDRPPPVLHHVLRATFLLLGEDEETTSDWKKCRAVCNPNGKNGLQRKIMTFDTKAVHPELMARCKELLDEFSVTEVQKISAGAGTFFVWAKGVMSEVERQNPGADEKVVPASIYRQQVILNRLPPSPPRFRRNRRKKPPATDSSNVISPPESSRNGNVG